MANIVLAVDLAWRQSGWAILQDNEPEMLIRVGHFVAKKHPDGRREDILYTTRQIFDYFYGLSASLLNAAASQGNTLHICYEITDWHQNLSRDDGSAYARERNAQRTLGRAETAFALGVYTSTTISPVPLGAVEVKNQFGATKKQDIAQLLQAEWPGKIQVDRNGFYYFDGVRLTDGMTDAMAIGHVYLDNLRRETLIERR